MKNQNEQIRQLAKEILADIRSGKLADIRMVPAIDPAYDYSFVDSYRALSGVQDTF